MSSARKAPSLRRHIVAVSLSAGALLFLLSGGLILFVSWSFMKSEYEGFLARSTSDLVGEYAESKGDLKEMRHFFDEDVEEHGADRIFLLLTDPAGRDVLNACADKTILRTMLSRAQRNLPAYRISKESDLPHHNRIVLRVKTTVLPDGFKLSIGHNVTADEQYLLFLAITLGGAFLFSLLLGGWAADWLARRFVRSLQNVSDAADRIRAGEWSTRVTPSHESRELVLLEDAFNTMCDQNEKTLTELKTLTDDIAHDLRTPLTRLRTAAEFAAMGGELNRPLPEMLFEQSSDMLELINTMLEISQTGCKLDRTPREDIDLCAFLHETVELYATVLDDQKLAINLDLPKESVVFSGHRGRLQRLLGNLLDNAIKFTPGGGVITLSLVRTASAVVLRVSDTGCGIAPEEIPHIFRRFWRSDSSRSLPGNGLGLALAKAIVTSYAGTITCESSLGKGTTFTITIPGDVN
ncbi:MAG: HAMP domain-containing histidine kinase [Kiritimatiellae bacterium]|nr:HAMP domain-containing histidine kinase [Kiritimatiellia bacterium]